MRTVIFSLLWFLFQFHYSHSLSEYNDFQNWLNRIDALYSVFGLHAPFVEASLEMEEVTTELGVYIFFQKEISLPRYWEKVLSISLDQYPCNVLLEHVFPFVATINSNFVYRLHDLTTQYYKATIQRLINQNNSTHDSQNTDVAVFSAVTHIQRVIWQITHAFRDRFSSAVVDASRNTPSYICYSLADEFLRRYICHKKRVSYPLPLSKAKSARLPVSSFSQRDYLHFLYKEIILHSSSIPESLKEVSQRYALLFPDFEIYIYAFCSVLEVLVNHKCVNPFSQFIELISINAEGLATDTVHGFVETPLEMLTRFVASDIQAVKRNDTFLEGPFSSLSFFQVKRQLLAWLSSKSILNLLTRGDVAPYLQGRRKHPITVTFLKTTILKEFCLFFEENFTYVNCAPLVYRFDMPFKALVQFFFESLHGLEESTSISPIYHAMIIIEKSFLSCIFDRPLRAKHASLVLCVLNADVLTRFLSPDMQLLARSLIGAFSHKIDSLSNSSVKTVTKEASRGLLLPTPQHLNDYDVLFCLFFRLYDCVVYLAQRNRSLPEILRWFSSLTHL